MTQFKEKWRLATRRERVNLLASLEWDRHHHGHTKVWVRDTTKPPKVFNEKSGWELFALQTPGWANQLVVARRRIRPDIPVMVISDRTPRYEFRYGIEARALFNRYPTTLVGVE